MCMVKEKESQMTPKYLVGLEMGRRGDAEKRYNVITCT